jgi:hypothetical protein
MRRLFVTRRVVPLDRLDEYDAGWRALRDAATSAGTRAWRFRRAGHEDQYIEFLESVVDGALEALDVDGARSHLEEQFGTTESSEWEEADSA